MAPQNKLFTIREVSAQLELPKHTLRFYEKQFEGILVPIRTDGGQRRYSLENLFVLKEIKNQRKRGKSLAEIKNELIINYSSKLNNTDSATIDLLVNRVAELLKAEIFEFLIRND